MRLNKNDIQYILRESVNKLSLNESMTDITFHFTTYEGLEGILSSNEFKLANQGEHFQKWASDTKPYYMCVTRQKYGDTGYGHARDDFKVRITLNGRLLNQRYKTIVYDYFINNFEKTGRDVSTSFNGGKLPYKQSEVENEERLLSEKPTIPNASKYILRIDIFTEDRYEEKLFVEKYKELSEKLGISDIVYVYTKKNDFDIQNKKGTPILEYLTIFEKAEQLLKNGEDPDNIFEDVSDFNEGFAGVYLNGKCNFIDTEGNILSKQWFDETSEEFNEGYASVKLNGKWNFIDTEGNIFFKQWFDIAYNFRNGYASVKLNGKGYNFIDTEGNILSNQWFDLAHRFIDGFAIVFLNKKCNFIDTEGNFLSNQWFDRCDLFRNGYAIVKLNGKCNLIDTEGNILSNQWFDDAHNFNEGYARVFLNKKYNFIDAEGNILSKQWFDIAFDFSNGYAIVKLNGKCNFIGTKGNILSKQWFDNVGCFYDDECASFSLNGKYGFIDKEGNFYDEYKKRIEL